MAKKKKQKKATSTAATSDYQPTQPAGPGTKDINQLDTPSLRVFSGIVAILFLFGIFAMNDVTTIWSGAEAKNLWEALSDQPSSWLTHFLHAVYDDGPLSVFYLRFFGLFFFLLILTLSFFIGKRLFGKNTIWLAILLLGASLLVPNIAKRATTDIYLFSSQLLFGMSTLIFLKSPNTIWRVLWLLGLWISYLLEPLGSLLFAIPFVLVLWRSHPQASSLRDWHLWWPALAGLGLLTVLRPVPWLDQGISFGWLRSGYLHFLSWQGIALLPFIGFAVGGIRDLFYKIKRGEEFSLLLAAWILAALLSQSITLSWVLALLAAKQMQLYFNPKYPFFSWVRGPAILHLLLIFFVLVFGLIYGFWQFRGEGFRSLLAVSGLYWGMSLLGVIGLYGYNHRLLIGAPILAGVLLTVLFWFQVGPLLESKRNWTSAIVELARNKQSENRSENLLLFYPPDQAPFPAMAVYGLDRMRTVNLLATEEALTNAVENAAGILILEKTTAGQLDMLSNADTLSGWNDRLEAVRYQVISQ